MRLVCRVCLQTSLEFIDMESPFIADIEQRSEERQITYLDCFRACTQLEIETSDSVPQCLCFACCNELKAAYSFLIKALDAERVLQARQLNIMEHEVKENEEPDEDKIKMEFFAIDLEHDETFTEQHMPDNDDVHELDVNPTAVNNGFDAVDDHVEKQIMVEEEALDDTQIVINEICESVSESQESTFLIHSESDENEFACDDDTIQCQKCNKNFSSDMYITHMQTSDCAADITVHCSNCSQYFPTKSELAGHKCVDSKIKSNSENYDSLQQRLFCSICSKKFSHEVALNAHLKYHLRKEANLKTQACNICGKTFSSQYYRQLHEGHVHRNDRELFPCEYCDKTYFSKTALDAHTRIHTGETKECPVCNKQFIRQYELNVHMRFHTGDFPFSCDVCGKRFAIKGHLRSHMWKHQGLKLQCDDCGKLFTSTKALQEHSFTHTEMPYRCSYCDKGYPSKQKYKVHLRKAHFVELDAQELEKVIGKTTPKPLQRKKRTLVQADSVVKEVVVKTKRDEDMGTQATD